MAIKILKHKTIHPYYFFVISKHDYSNTGENKNEEVIFSYGAVLNKRYRRKPNVPLSKLLATSPIQEAKFP